MAASKKGRPTKGTIEKRGEAQWRARITVGDKRRSKTFADQVSAESWVRDLRQAAFRGQLPKLLRAQAMTLAEALKRYEDYECPPKSVSAVKSAIARLSETEAPLMAMALWDIDETDIGDLIQRRLAQGVMNATVNHDLTYIGRAFVLARTKWGCAKLHNPASRMKLRVDDSRVRRFRPGEEDALLQAARSYELGPRASVRITLLIRFAAKTAMRLGEIARMDWEHVNMDRGTVYLRATKNDHPRTVAMAPSTIAILRELGPQRSGSVWGSYEAIRTAWRRVRSAAAKQCPTLETDPFRFHDLRHEGTSRFFEDTDLADAEIATITGHRSAQSLWRYRHLRADRTAKKLADAEGRREPPSPRVE